MAGERKEQFGHVVLQVRGMETYYLDLYETHADYAPGLACRGFYLQPARYRGGRAYPVPVQVELSMDDDAFNAIYEMSGGGSFGEDSWDPDAPYSTSNGFRIGGPGADVNLVFNAQVSAPLRLPDKSVWTGWLGGRGSGPNGEQINGQFDFILEQYGTIEPVTLLLVALFFVTVVERDGGLHAEECYERALRMCGHAGNIKSVNATSGITGMTLRKDKGCQIECFERRTTQD